MKRRNFLKTAAAFLGATLVKPFNSAESLPVLAEPKTTKIAETTKPLVPRVSEVIFQYGTKENDNWSEQFKDGDTHFRFKKIGSKFTSPVRLVGTDG